MQASDPSCPVCMADVPLAGDEKAGEAVFCTYCNAPLRLSTAAKSDNFELDEDF
jgi:hypothetical protein